MLSSHVSPETSKLRGLEVFFYEQVAGLELDDRAESPLKQMALEEKIGQLVQYSPGTGRAPPSRWASMS
jgi:hypothetical protein